jgi:hypothetical protein
VRRVDVVTYNRRATLQISREFLDAGFHHLKNLRQNVKCLEMVLSKHKIAMQRVNKEWKTTDLVR